MITHRQSIAIATNGSNSFNGVVNEVGASETVLDNTFAAGANQSITFTLTVANLQSCIIIADQNCTLETNSTSSPGNTINLIAGDPLIWSKSSGYFPNPFTTNVTVFYLTTTTATRLKYKFLFN